MKYLFATLAAMAVIFSLGYLLARLMLKKASPSPRKGRMLLLTILNGMAILLLAGAAYFAVCYRADETAQAALQGSETVSVTKIDGGYFFDGPAAEKAVVFYPGAKVECEAYAPLMLTLAERGFDCFLADVPLNFALFGEGLADKFVSAYDYDSWLTGGHSMGGIVAAGYARKHPESVDGVILLASYTTAEPDAKVCSVYGSEDGCLERNVYANNRCNWPEGSAELIIEGGNHAQFGSYGAQKGDGEATVSAREQWAATADAIASLY